MGDLYIFIMIGFAAQMIDGFFGMAYGVLSNTFLLSFGMPPLAASASIHIAEVFTTFISGLSHLKFGNVDKTLLKKLLLPGITGGVLGACILTMVSGEKIKPFIAVYLLALGFIIILKARRKARERKVRDKLISLATVGGFFDAIGGGGWGPIVTSTLIAKGNNPKVTIGSVNLAEFFVTVAQAVTFFAILELIHWQIIVGLIIGGILAAPIAAFLCKKIPSQKLMALVGLLIVVLSTRTLYLSLVH